MSFIRKNIFLIDAIGALMSCLSLGFLLPYLKTGFPADKAVTLALWAGLLFVFSTSCFFLVKKNKSSWLKVVIAANLLYCVFTLFTVLSLSSQMKALGLAYFAVEVILILTLVHIEYKVATQEEF